MSDHWAKLLQSGLLLKDCSVATPKLSPQRGPFLKLLRDGVICVATGDRFPKGFNR